jgi:hypothetical protein
METITWRKSTRSGSTGQCVEVADLHDEIRVRDSKHSDGPTLSFAHADWAAFIDRVKTGMYDR